MVKNKLPLKFGKKFMYIGIPMTHIKKNVRLQLGKKLRREDKNG